MIKLTAAQKRYIENATLISALQLIFQKLKESEIPIYCLSEIAETTSGGTPSRTASSYYDGDIPWIKSGELNDGIIEQAEEFITDEGLKNSSAKIYPKGTLVIALYGATVGKLGILGIDAASNQAVCAVKPKTNKVSTNFLFWFLRHKRQDFLNDSFGGAQPNISQKILRETCLPLPDTEIQEKICTFLKVVEKRQNGEKHLELPKLPTPLKEQRRIVGCVEELLGKVEEVRSLRQKALEENNLIYKNLARQIFDNYIESSISIEKLVGRTNLKNGKSIRATEQVSKIKCIKLSAIRDGQIDCTDSKPVPMSYEEAQQYLVKAEDVFILRGNGSKHLVGQAEIVKKYAEGTIFPDLFIQVPLDRHKILPSFFVAWWNNPLMREKIIEVAKTTSGIWKINQGHIASFSIPVPPLSEQRCIVAYLDELQAKVDAMKRLRKEAIKELDALLPSILDKAFKGEL